MLQITIPAREIWDGECFFYTKEQVLSLEHSLLSIAKWESKWCKPFFSKNDKNRDEAIDYVRCMTLIKNVDPYVQSFLTEKDLSDIDSYVTAPMTAAWFNGSNTKGGNRNGEQLTAESIYYWMIELNIPFECEKWHLNRLLALIRFCSIKQSPPKKMSRREILNQNTMLNNARRKQRAKR